MLAYPFHQHGRTCWPQSEQASIYVIRCFCMSAEWKVPSHRPDYYLCRFHCYRQWHHRLLLGLICRRAVATIQKQKT